MKSPVQLFPRLFSLWRSVHDMTLRHLTSLNNPNRYTWFAFLNKKPSNISNTCAHIRLIRLVSPVENNSAADTLTEMQSKCCTRSRVAIIVFDSNAIPLFFLGSCSRGFCRRGLTMVNGWHQCRMCNSVSTPGEPGSASIGHCTCR